MRLSFIIILGVFLLTAALLNVFLKEPTFNNLPDKANFEISSNQPEFAEQTIFKIIEQDSFNIDNHVHCINTHFDIPAKKKVGKNSYVYRDDNPISNYYDSLSISANPKLSDIGYYGKGLIAVRLENYGASIKEFKKVENKNLKYLNNSIGNAYSNSGNTKEAEYYFRKEIENNGNMYGAYYNLIQLLFDKGATKEIKELLNNEETRQYFPSRVERAIYFENFQPVKYAIVLFKRVFSDFNIWGLIAAFLIMGSWIMYLRKIDIFEMEKWRNIIIVVALGMLFCFLTYPLSDFNNLIFGFQLNGNFLNDFFYSVLGIGAIEEFVKIIPLLIILKFTKIINEPFDYIIYASLSALGFAFIENLIYFGNHDLFIISGRALTAVVSHMFDSSIIAYGLILNKYKRHINPYLNFLFFFALAALSHGFYDFWLINKTANDFNFLSLLFLLVSIYMWNSFKNNALNQSSFYDKNISVNTEKLQDYLLYSLSGVLLFEYVALAFKFCPSVANNGLMSSISSGTYLIVFLSVNLSKITLNKGEWAPIEYWRTENKVSYEQIVGTEVKLSRFTHNDFAFKYLPNSGEIIKRMTVSKEPDWYLVKLTKPVNVISYIGDTVIIRSKDKEEQIITGKEIYIAFYIIPEKTNLENEDLKRTDFIFCGWATVV